VKITLIQVIVLTGAVSRQHRGSVLQLGPSAEILFI
jgi:hypothetical protein